MAQENKRKKRGWVVLVVVAVLLVLIYTQLTIFVIQPIGAIPEGKTIVILRLRGDNFSTKFVDSADAACERIQGSVSLFCRAAVLGAVVDKSPILLRLPYSEWLYKMSTGGKVYDR